MYPNIPNAKISRLCKAILTRDGELEHRKYEKSLTPIEFAEMIEIFGVPPCDLYGNPIDQDS
ncbi:hypothetical protein [Nonlabens ulvanivorans]|uniref:hypothetical protein n=1 Tax=Nonlabens ulvanivorans TaxID=906888 RepID=UPI0037C66F17